MSLRRLPVALGLLSLLSVPAVSATDPIRDDVMLNLQRCSAITDNRTWLNCFYGAAQPMRAQLGLPAAPEAQVSLVKNTPMAPPPMKSESASGSSGWLGIGNIFGSSGKEDENTPGAMRLSDFSFGKDGLFTVTLADGEVWKQSPYDDLRAHWSGQASGYIGVVTSDMLGSHTLRVRGDQSYRVMRIK